MNNTISVNVESINMALCAYKSATYHAEQNDGAYIRIYRLDSDFVTQSMIEYVGQQFNLGFIGCGSDEKGTYALFQTKENGA